MPRLYDHRLAGNRVALLLAHSTRYAFRSQIRLSREARVSHSTISRVLRGKQAPTFATAVWITEALEQELGIRLDPRDVLSLSGKYPTRDICTLVGCRRCAFTGTTKYETVSARTCLNEE